MTTIHSFEVVGPDEAWDVGEGLWHYHLIDVEVLAAGKLGVAPPYKSDELAAQFGIVANEDAKHTAAGDVDWTMRLYAAIYGLEIT